MAAVVDAAATTAEATTSTITTTAMPTCTKELREIGHEAVWSLSTAKPGNGVEQIRDDNMDTYWQSDGAQPHLINVQFHKKMTILEVALYLDYSLDESYTPKKISIKAGTTFHDLVEIQVVNLKEPQGWVKVPVRNPYADGPNGPGSLVGMDTGESQGSVLRAFFLQISIIAMHQNGRDTHVRQAKIYGPRSALAPFCGQSRAGVGGDLEAFCSVPEFTTSELAQFSTVR